MNTKMGVHFRYFFYENGKISISGELNEEDVLLDKSAMFNLAGKRQRDNRVSLYRFMVSFS